MQLTGISRGGRVDVNKNTGIAGRVDSWNFDGWGVSAATSTNVELEAGHVELGAANATGYMKSYGEEASTSDRNE